LSPNHFTTPVNGGGATAMKRTKIVCEPWWSARGHFAGMHAQKSNAAMGKSSTRATDRGDPSARSVDGVTDG